MATSVQPDDFTLHVRSTGREDFVLAMKLAFEDKQTAKSFKIEEGTFRLFWSDGATHGSGAGSTKLPYDMSVDEAIELVWGWLNKKKPAGNPDDFDGSSGKGFELKSAFGHENFYLICQVTPVWVEYHK